eukprot:978265_1
MNSKGFRSYNIDNNISNLQYANSFCPIFHDQFNIDYCFNRWYTTINYSWKYDPNMLAMDCDPICINGNTYSWINGKYIWTHFNRTTNSSVYHCSNCLYSLYLYGYVIETVI